MRLLLDTHLLLWAAGDVSRLSEDALALLGDPRNELVFSAASLWEIAIKSGLQRADFQVDPRLLRRELLIHGYREIPIAGEHLVAVLDLPKHHKDPFDRILIAQSAIEGAALITSDKRLQEYRGDIRVV